MLSKILRALVGIPTCLRRQSNPRIIMTLLVKNEGDLLEQNLIFHRQMGVDAFIITDHSSSDNTPQIIRAYQEKGWIVEVIHETGVYKQKVWVDRMIQLAMRHKADWVINADADEFWYIPGSFKPLLSATRTNVLKCDLHNVYPQEGKPWHEWTETVRAIAPEKAAAYDLSAFSVFSRQIGKVMHRANGYLRISMGNHKVLMLVRRKRHADVIIYHYCVRGKAHWLQKMINGGQQFENNPRKREARHWRYYYDIYKQGKLEEEYSRVVGTNYYDTLKREGYIVEDNPIPALSLMPLSSEPLVAAAGEGLQDVGEAGVEEV